MLTLNGKPSMPWFWFTTALVVLSNILLIAWIYPTNTISEFDKKLPKPRREGSLAIVPREHNPEIFDDVSKIKFGFNIENNTEETIGIKALLSSCPCATGELSSDSIPPNSISTFLIDYSVSKRYGQLSRYKIQIVTDSKSQPILDCYVGAIRKKRYDVSPAVVSFGVLAEGVQREQTVTIKGEGDFDLDSISSGHPQLKLSNVNGERLGKKHLVSFTATLTSKTSDGFFESTMGEQLGTTVVVPKCFSRHQLWQIFITSRIFPGNTNLH